MSKNKQKHVTPKVVQDDISEESKLGAASTTPPSDPEKGGTVVNAEPKKVEKSVPIDGVLNLYQFKQKLATSPNANELFHSLLEGKKLENPRACAIEAKRLGHYVDYETD